MSRSINSNEKIRELIRSYSELLSQVLKIKIYKMIKEDEENKNEAEIENEVNDLVMEALMLPLPIKNVEINKDEKKIIIEIGDEGEKTSTSG